MIKVERPLRDGVGGDDTRGWGPPFLHDREGRDTAEAAYYLGTNRNKRSITVDISKPEGQVLLRELAAKCDILVENYKLGDLKRYGLDYQSLARVNPKLVYCSITAYGQDGPYAQRPGYDLLCQAEGGLMAINGHADVEDGGPGGGPVKVVIAVTDVLSGLNATIGILAAVEARHSTGRGQHIDIALLDSIVQFGANQIATYFITGKQPKRVGNAHVNLAPYQSFRTADGYMIVGAGNDGQWRKLCEAMGSPDMAFRPEYLEMKDRNAHRPQLVRDMEAILTKHPTQHWLDTFASLGIPHAPINTYDQVFAHPQVQHRALKMSMERPAEQGGGAVAMVASPIRMSDTPVTYRHAPPVKGSSTESILLEVLGKSAAEAQALRDRGVV